MKEANPAYVTTSAGFVNCLFCYGFLRCGSSWQQPMKDYYNITWSELTYAQACGSFGIMAGGFIANRLNTRLGLRRLSIIVGGVVPASFLIIYFIPPEWYLLILPFHFSLTAALGMSYVVTMSTIQVTTTFRAWSHKNRSFHLRSILRLNWRPRFKLRQLAPLLGRLCYPCSWRGYSANLALLMAGFSMVVWQHIFGSPWFCSSRQIKQTEQLDRVWLNLMLRRLVCSKRQRSGPMSELSVAFAWDKWLTFSWFQMWWNWPERGILKLVDWSWWRQ